MTGDKTSESSASARGTAQGALPLRTTVVEMGDEGGGYTIEGRKSNGQWQYRLVACSDAHQGQSHRAAGTEGGTRSEEGLIADRGRAALSRQDHGACRAAVHCGAVSVLVRPASRLCAVEKPGLGVASGRPGDQFVALCATF